MLTAAWYLDVPDRARPVVKARLTGQDLTDGSVVSGHARLQLAEDWPAQVPLAGLLLVPLADSLLGAHRYREESGDLTLDGIGTFPFFPSAGGSSDAQRPPGHWRLETEGMSLGEHGRRVAAWVANVLGNSR